MRARIGEILLILAIILFVLGAVGFVVGFLPQNAIVATGASALIFVGAGASIKRRVRK